MLKAIPEKYLGRWITAKCDPTGETRFRLVALPSRLASMVAGLFPSGLPSRASLEKAAAENEQNRQIVETLIQTAVTNDTRVTVALVLYSLKEIVGLKQEQKRKGKKEPELVDVKVQFSRTPLLGEDLQAVDKEWLDKTIPQALWNEIFEATRRLYMLSDEDLDAQGFTRA